MMPLAHSSRRSIQQSPEKNFNLRVNKKEYDKEREPCRVPPLDLSLPLNAGLLMEQFPVKPLAMVC